MRAVWLVVLSLAAQLVSAQYSCQKDDRCFDDIYTCTDCCNDGMSANNLPCWDKLGSFSSARCCTQGATATIESIMTVINNRAADLSTLATALKAGDLTGALADTNQVFTVFAPTNTAFAKIQGAVNSLLRPENKAELQKVLRNHVVSGKYTTSDLRTGMSFKTLSGEAITYMGNPARIMNDPSSIIITADVMATNGVVHLINGVLLPKPASTPKPKTPAPVYTPAYTPLTPSTPSPIKLENIPTLASANYDLSTLVAALRAAALIPALSYDTLTVFAPRNAAFSKIQPTVDNLLLPANKPQLEDVLKYHVVPGRYTSANLYTGNGLTLTTLQGSKITLLSGQVQGASNAANIVTADVIASNGVVHIIDSVLLPPEAPAPLPGNMNIPQLASSRPELSTLVAALKAADLVPTLSDETALFTVFAPTASAFSAIQETVNGLLQPENKPQLAEVLKYHVVRGVYKANDIYNGQRLPTLQGDEVRLSINPARVNDVTITMPDLTASNGVVHVIDAVLLKDNAVCAKDSKCFDDTYPCEQCCTTGLSILSKSCWDAIYTVERCCLKNSPPPASPVYKPTPQTIGECEKDGSCFDQQYTCSSCCSSDKTIFGVDCWDEQYTRSRCCNPVADFADPPAPVQVPSPSCVDTHSPPQQCGIWASLGECERTPGYMRERCCGSCGLAPAIPSPIYVPYVAPTPPPFYPAPNAGQAGYIPPTPAPIPIVWTPIYSPAYNPVAQPMYQYTPVINPTPQIAMQPYTPVYNAMSPQSGGCTDALVECQIWAILGECKLVYTQQKCCQSCQAVGRRSSLVDSRGQPKSSFDTHGKPLPLPYVFNQNGDAVDSRGHPVPQPPADAKQPKIVMVLASVAVAVGACLAIAAVVLHRVRRASNRGSGPADGLALAAESSTTQHHRAQHLCSSCDVPAPITHQILV